jgi:hypothetical protein
MSLEAKNFIQSCVGKNFDAQEIWINQRNNFWAVDIQDNQVFITSGLYLNGDIISETICYETRQGYNFVQAQVERKINEGYFCFAMLI